MAKERSNTDKEGVWEKPQDATLIDHEFELLARQALGGIVPEEIADSGSADAPSSTTAAVSEQVPDAAGQSAVVRQVRLAVQAFEHNMQGIFVSDAKNRIVLVNRAFEAITGYPQEGLIGKTPASLAAEPQEPEFLLRALEAMARSGAWDGEFRCRRRDGSVFPARLAMRRVKDAGGATLTHVCTLSDISAHKQGVEDLRRQAQHDPLTGLANRSLLHDRLQQAIASCNRSGGRLAVLFLDLDRFKTINDSLGHATGDKLLQHAARKLKTCVREEDTVARIGGDEFVVVLRNVSDVQGAVQVARKIGHEIHGPYRIEGRDLTVTTSIGISIYPDDEGDEYSMIQHADTAMYQAKERGRNSYAFYQQHMTVQAKERLLLENSLLNAINKDDFLLHYQPQIDILTRRISGGEALIRWQHPELGLLSPDRFIPLAEETGLIRPIGSWVMRSVAAEMRTWLAAGLPPVRIAVNLSGKQVLRAKHAESLRALISESGMPIKGMELEIEITESCIQTGEQTLEAAHALKSLGLTLAIDDFGTGYSSMVSLRSLPIDRIKIDRSFVKRLPSDSNDAAITSAIIAMSKALGLKTLAEGVETREQLEFLRLHGCDEAQGFLFSQPIPAEAFRELVARQQTFL